MNIKKLARITYNMGKIGIIFVILTIIYLFFLIFTFEVGKSEILVDKLMIVIGIQFIWLIINLFFFIKLYLQERSELNEYLRENKK